MIVREGDNIKLKKQWGGYLPGTVLAVRERRQGGMVFLTDGLIDLARGWTTAALDQYFEPPAVEHPAEVSVKDKIADEAKRIVSGARRGAYGTPEDNFVRIARFWTAYLQNTGRDVTITPGDVSPLMRLMKEARLCETPDHLDSHVDLIGYTLTGAEVNKVEFPD